MNLELAASYGATSVLLIGFLSLLNPIATSINLVDHPDGELKQHTGTIPLMSGAAIFMTLLIVLILTPLDTNAIAYPEYFWPAVGILLDVLVITHVFDDIRGISAVVRLTLDGGIAVMLCTIALLHLDTLGYLFGDSETTMGRWAIPMTVFSFVAASNAFNMTDGIDSLCAGLGIIGCIPLLLIVLAGLWTQIRLLRHRSQFTRGVAFGCLTGTISLLIHSATDFNLQIPSNATLFLVLLALPQALALHDI